MHPILRKRNFVQKSESAHLRERNLNPFLPVAIAKHTYDQATIVADGMYVPTPVELFLEAVRLSSYRHNESVQRPQSGPLERRVRLSNPSTHRMLEFQLLESRLRDETSPVER